MYPKSKEATALAKSVRTGPLKRLRRAGAKAPAKKPPRRVALTTVSRPKKKPRRVALTTVSRPKKPKRALGGRSLTAGQVSEYKAVRRLGKRANLLKGRDAAPELAFSITDRWANDTGM